MRSQNRLHRLAADPILVGALTSLIVIVAVFLAYNANLGLPFVPTYRISAEVPNANSLVRNNDVRIGGVRVGTVQTIQPVQESDGGVHAELDLILDKSVEPLPADTTFVVRTRSALGLKFLELQPGGSQIDLPEGGKLGLDQARPEPVELDQIFNMFQPPVRRGIQQTQVELGGALAGRGATLNAAIRELRPLLERLIPVMRNLSSPQTDLAGFLRSLEQVSSEVAPVAETQAHMFVVLDETFSALAAVARPYIQESITRGVKTEDTALATLPVIRPFLRNSTALFANLRPASRALDETAPTLAATLAAGTPVLRATPALNAQLAPTARALVKFQQNPNVVSGIEALNSALATLDPTLAFLTPAQTVCHYPSILLRNAAGTVSESDRIGTWLRDITIIPPFGQPNAESGPASAPANGPGTENHLHYNPYPNTAAPGQVHECEAGNVQYATGKTAIGNAPGNQGTITDEGTG